MHFQLEPLIDGNAASRIRAQLEQAPETLWYCGHETAGRAAKTVKDNHQLDAASPLFEELSAHVISAFQANPLFRAAAIPLKIHGLIFSRCAEGQGYGSHVDNAFMPAGRTDLSFTLFLSDISSYSGGELVIELPQGDVSIRLPAGHALVYPSAYLHRVAPVASGVRYVAVGWVQSAIRSLEQRELLFELDTACKTLLANHGPSRALDLLYRCQNNLLRMWGA